MYARIARFRRAAFAGTSLQLMLALVAACAMTLGAVTVASARTSLYALTTHSRRVHAGKANGQSKTPAIVTESGPLKGVLYYTDEPIVSIDIVHTPASSTVDSLETAVIDGKLVRVVSWYDNEWGFSNRMVDTASAMAKLG